MNRMILLLALMTGCVSTVESSTTGGQGGTASTATGGAGGLGGSGGAGGSTTTTECDKQTAFLGWSECFDSSAACCDLGGVNPEKLCFVKTFGNYIHPIFCDSVPTLGGAETDHRSCEVVSNAVYSCAWGNGSLICCD